MTDDNARRFGIGRGKVFPESSSWQLTIPGRRLIQSPVRHARRLALAPGATVLDLGCGPGYFALELLRSAPGAYVVECDLQFGMLTRALARCPADGMVAAAEADAQQLPFRDGTFDAVSAVTVLGEVPDRDRCCIEIARVLKEGGILAVGETIIDPDFERLRTLARRLESAGLRLTRTHGAPFHYTAIFAKA